MKRRQGNASGSNTLFPQIFFFLRCALCGFISPIARTKNGRNILGSNPIHVHLLCEQIKVCSVPALFTVGEEKSESNWQTDVQCIYFLVSKCDAVT